MFDLPTPAALMNRNSNVRCAAPSASTCMAIKIQTRFQNAATGVHHHLQGHAAQSSGLVGGLEGGVTMVPKCLYTTQNFTTWLKFFLSRKVIDDALQETQRKHSPTWNSLPSVMRDVQGSPGWYNLFGGERGAYDLSFGIYVDWFRAFKLKIAGKCL